MPAQISGLDGERGDIARPLLIGPENLSQVELKRISNQSPSILVGYNLVADMS